MPKTIESAFKNADNPKNLHIGVVQQSTKSDRVDFSQNPHVSEVWLPPQKAKGAGYARHLAQTMYNGEDFFLQVDSHTRFEPHWDTIALSMYHEMSSATNNSRIILSHFPRAYVAEGGKDTFIDTEKYPATPHRQVVYWFNKAMFSGKRVPFNDPSLSMPEESETILAGFVFAPGGIVAEVPYDPNICFWGEELAFSVRAWTRGWRIYSPNKMIVSHFYQRRGHHKVWDRNNLSSKWAIIERDSMLRQNMVYTGELTGVWGAKDIPSLNSYKEFINMDIGSVYTSYLKNQEILADQMVESDIFAGVQTKPLSPLCIKQFHTECNNKQCECDCHGSQ